MANSAVKPTAMDSASSEQSVVSRRMRFIQRLLIAVGAGILLAIAFPPYHLPYFLPLAMAILFYAVRGATAREAVYLGLACGIVFLSGTLFWLGNVFGAASISLIAILTAFIGLFAGLNAKLAERLPRVPKWLLAAILWTGIEFYRSEPFPLSFGWMDLGYATVNSPLLAKIASCVGVYGLSFLIVVLGAAMITPKRVLGILALWIVVCLVPRPLSAPTHPITVRLVQAMSEDDEDLFGQSHPIAGLHPDVIVWPEYSFDSDPTRQPPLWRKLQQVAQSNHCYFLFGAKDQFDLNDPAGFRNTAYLLDPSGNLVGRHVKNHPVHFIRDGVAGKVSQALPTNLGPIGVGICFDMDYPDVARRLSQSGAQVFLVPNDDPAEWRPVQRALHRLLFQMRCAECGRWLARADVAGGTSVAAPSGQEAHRVDTSDSTVLTAQVGRLTGRTLFIRGGWLFGPVCFWITLALCLWALLPARFR